MDQDLYYLAHPRGNKDEVNAKLEEIAKANHLMELLNDINVPNVYAKCDIFASRWLKLKNYSDQQVLEKRSGIEVRMRKWNDPRIVEKLAKRYPGLAITVLTQASPEPYIRKSYEETLKDTNVSITIAPGYRGTTLTKMESRLYRLIKQNNPHVTAFIDDDPKREQPAIEGGIDAVGIYKGHGQEDLAAASEAVLKKAYGKIENLGER